MTFRQLFRLNEDGVRVHKAQLVSGNVLNALNGTGFVNSFLQVGVCAFQSRRLLLLFRRCLHNAVVHPSQGNQGADGEDDQGNQGDFQRRRGGTQPDLYLSGFEFFHGDYLFAGPSGCEHGFLLL